MGNRIIKESICTSDNIDQLSTFQETFFYRLIVNCDDHGRMDARPRILAARLFPLKSIREDQIRDALRGLTSAELVTLYTVDGKPFLQMNTWERHQQIRAVKEKYPGPDKADPISDDITCNQMISDDISRNQMIPSRARAESESNTNPNTNPNPTRARARETDAAFDSFWTEFPKKVKKPNAVRAWQKLQPDEELVTKIMQGLARWKSSDQWTRDDGRFIPHPATWLNDRQWEDEVQPRRSAGVMAQGYAQRDYSGVQDEIIAQQDAEVMEFIGREAR